MLSQSHCKHQIVACSSLVALQENCFVLVVLWALVTVGCSAAL